MSLELLKEMSPSSGRMIRSDGTIINFADAFYLDAGEVKLRISGGDAFQNPMPNGTFLQTIDKDDNTIPLAGYLDEVVVFGDYKSGNTSVLASSDEFTTFSSTVTVEEELVKNSVESLIEDEEKSITSEINIQGSVETKYETFESFPSGVIEKKVMRSAVPTNGNALWQLQFDGVNDLESDVTFYQKTVYGENVSESAETGRVVDSIMVNGSLLPSTTILPNGVFGIYSKQVTPDTTTVFASLYADVGGEMFVSLSGGETVPTDGEEGFITGSLFTLITAGDAEIYINVGNQISAKFRKITTS